MAFLNRKTQKIYSIGELMDRDNISDEEAAEIVPIDEMIAPIVEWLIEYDMAIVGASDGGMIDEHHKHTYIEFMNTVVGVEAPKGFCWKQKNTILESKDALPEDDFSARIAAIYTNLTTLANWATLQENTIKKRPKM